MTAPVRTYAGWRTYYDRAIPGPQSNVITSRFFDISTGKVSRSFVWRMRRHRFNKWIHRPWIRVQIVLFPKYGLRLALAEQKITRLENQIDSLVEARLR